MARVIDNGSVIPGTILKHTNDAFKETVKSADLIISKGQGNYETLDEEDLPMFFILIVKCKMIAKAIGLPVGSFILKYRE